MPQEKRKWQMEMENKRRQLEDDKRSLQHLKSKALRERWLLDGAPSSGPEHDEVKRQLQQDEERSRDLEENICRLERELVVLESEGGPAITPTPVVKTEVEVPDVEVVSVKPESDRSALVSSVPVWSCSVGRSVQYFLLTVALVHGFSTHFPEGRFFRELWPSLG
ncbi:hypothetical protein WMY93_024688 [Mugilogobius chulae]|uniref:Paralemmin-1 n=1 Tax=Mugilogobius chulae TaxID=88201 RepID=A0AAW0N1Z9_9GOBI